MRAQPPTDQPRGANETGAFVRSLLALAKLFDLLSDVFAKPSSSVQARAGAMLRAGSLARVPLATLRRAVGRLAQADCRGADVEFVRLFLHGGTSTAHPYESYYRTGLLMDADCLADLNGLFAAVGLRPHDEGTVPPDHLAVQLAFLSLLLRGLATSQDDDTVRRTFRRIAGRLLRDHLLPFSAAFRSRLALLDPLPCFGAAADISTLALQATGTLLATPRTSRSKTTRASLKDSGWRNVPVFGGVLVGGLSSRMGSPKHALRHAGLSLVERAVAALAPHVTRTFLLGQGAVPASCASLPRVPDLPGVSGPLAGMLAAIRFAPNAAWLFSPCDLPLVTPAAVNWLLSKRAPGRWMVIPRVSAEGVEPLLALYEPQARAVLEELVACGELAPRLAAAHPRASVMMPPARLRACWRNANSPEELASLES